MDGSTADLMDERGDELDSCEIQFTQFGGRKRFSGRIRTVRCLEDNVLIRQVLATRGDGMILVVDGGGSYQRALLGDMMASSALEHGWSGVVIHGCVRDVLELGRLPIGIKALGSNPRPSAKVGNGEIDVPVLIGGVTFTPGAELFSDEDGIVVARDAGRPTRLPPSPDA